MVLNSSSSSSNNRQRHQLLLYSSVLLTTFSIENLGIFGARGSLASKLKGGRPGQALFEYRFLFRCLTVLD